MDIKWKCGELMGRKQLKRELEREALTRLEEAARSDTEFDNVTKWWDRLDANRERKERYHEQSVFDKMFDWDIFNDAIGYEEDYLTLIHLCICEMHNLVEDADISQLINKATFKQKTVFFPRIIVGCPTTKIALCHGMTDRNVRKLIDLMLDNLRKSLFNVLKNRMESKEPLTIAEREFMKNYIPKEKK